MQYLTLALVGLLAFTLGNPANLHIGREDDGMYASDNGTEVELHDLDDKNSTHVDHEYELFYEEFFEDDNSTVVYVNGNATIDDQTDNFNFTVEEFSDDKNVTIYDLEDDYSKFNASSGGKGYQDTHGHGHDNHTHSDSLDSSADDSDDSDQSKDSSSTSEDSKDSNSTDEDSKDSSSTDEDSSDSDGSSDSSDSGGESKEEVSASDESGEYSNENSKDTSDNRSGSSLTSEEKDKKRKEYLDKGIKNFDSGIKDLFDSVGKGEMYGKISSAPSLSGLFSLTLVATAFSFTFY